MEKFAGQFLCLHSNGPRRCVIIHFMGKKEDKNEEEERDVQNIFHGTGRPAAHH